MEKSYVYKVCANGIVCADLQSAVRVAVKSVLGVSVWGRATKPIVSKVKGGYQVSVINYAGGLHKARIDVFEPAEFEGKQYAIDETNASYKGVYFTDEVLRGKVQKSIKDEENDKVQDAEDLCTCVKCGQTVPEYEGDYNEDGEFICDVCASEEDEEDDFDEEEDEDEEDEDEEDEDEEDCPDYKHDEFSDADTCACATCEYYDRVNDCCDY